MATKLNKEVSRETSTRIGGRGKVIIVTLLPGDVITFREKGKHTAFETTLEACAWLAIKQKAAADRKEKAEARKAKRQGR